MKTSQRHSLIVVAGLTGYWARKTGGNVTGEVTKSYDGGSDVPELLPGFANHENVTVGRDYDPYRDGPIVRRLRPVVMRWRTTVSEQDTDVDLVPVGQPTVWPRALLLELHPPETDAASNTPKRLELVFAVAATV